MRYELKKMFLSFAIIMSSLLSSCCAFGDTNLPSVFKPIPQEYATYVPPNVLLLIDTSGSMLFNLTGGYTHGDGGSPYRNQFYYGQDTDNSNNDPDDGSLSYYPPVTYLTQAQIDDLGPNRLRYMGRGPDGRYLHPNDSRMYILKKVLWTIFTDPSMVEGLKIGLSTYHQERRYDTPGPVTYEFWDYRNRWRSRQGLSWQPTGERKGKMRLDFGLIPHFYYDSSVFSAGVPVDKIGSNQWYDLLSLLDGVENSDNDEVRGVGATPLGNSIHSGGKKPQDCAYSFIQPAIEYPCQDNWLIVLTDGEDSYSSTQPVTAVKTLFDANEKDPNWPKPFGQKAKPVRTFVIGIIDPPSTTLNKMAFEGRAWEVNNEINKTAYYATNTDSLLEAFRLIFRTIQSNKKSSSAPPKVLSGNEDSNIVYATSFVPRVDGAWPGYLYKKRFTSKDGYETLWDGTDRIKPWDKRPIYHAPWYDVSEGYLWNSNLRPFPSTGGGAGPVAYHAGVEDRYRDNFTRWIRGGHWDQSSNRVHVMIDSYRGSLFVMGPPPGSRPDSDFNAFAYENRQRGTVLFNQGNGGLLQIISDDSGDEVMAFIPPNVLHRSRIAGLVDNLVERNEGSSRYLLSGPLVVEDVKINPPYDPGDKYKTVLIGTLGYGGTGLYALDVTDPTKPYFLWARDSMVYSEGGVGFQPDKNDLLWRYSNAGSTLSSGEDVSKSIADLRRVLGRPFIGWVKDVGETRWITLFGAGAGSSQIWTDGSISLSNGGDEGGRAIYALDVASGERFHDPIVHDDLGQVIAEIAVAKGASRTEYLKIDKGYVGDTSGQIWRLSWDETVLGNWTLSKLADLSGPKGIPPFVHGLDLSKKLGQMWIFGATGDPFDIVPRSSRTISADCIVGFKEPESETLQLKDLKVLSGKEDQLNPEDDHEGWLLSLEEGEFSTTPPVVAGGKVFVATYIDSGGNPCEPGNARLYVLGAFDGKPFFDDGASGKKRYIELKGVRITSLEVKDNRIFAGVINPSGKNKDDLSIPSELNAQQDEDGSILTIDVPGPKNDDSEKSDKEIARSGYWRRSW